MNEQNPEDPEKQNLSNVLDKQDHDQPQPQPQAEPAEEAHVCSVCGSPNHMACGCEAKAAKESSQAQPDVKITKPTGEIPPNEQIAKALENEAMQQGFQDAVQAASNFGKQLQKIVEALVSIDSAVHDIVELEKSRRDLLKDVRNGS